MTKIPLANFIPKVLEAAKGDVELSVLGGYAGVSDRKGHVRLYPSPSLSSYVEIAEADVMHCEQIESSDLGMVRIWVKQSADLSERLNTKRSLADLLEGDVSQSLGPIGRKGPGHLKDTPFGPPTSYGVLMTPVAAGTATGLTPRGIFAPTDTGITPRGFYASTATGLTPRG